MSDPLARVRRATRKLEAARVEYRAAIAAAHTEGRSYAEIARAAGISRQGARKLLT